VPWVARGLATDDAAVRCAVIEALGRMPHHSASHALASALHHADEATRVAATYALARRDLRAARATGSARDDG
jgi:HEAT repeat protein